MKVWWKEKSKLLMQYFSNLTTILGEVYPEEFEISIKASSNDK